MSIAAVSPSFVSALRNGSAPAAIEPPEPARAAARVAPREAQGRRQALVDAVYQALAVEPAAQDSHETQAVYRFAHALMQDLHAMDGVGQGLGQRELGDMGQRLSALATAATKPDAGATPAVPEMPAQPNPVTTATAALHLMQVPSARLLEAFVAMHRALERQDEEGNPLARPDPRGALAAVIGKLARAATAESPIVAAAGDLLDLQA